MNKILQFLLPEKASVNYHQRRKSEYTALFLFLLTPYIIVAALMKYLYGGMTQTEIALNAVIIMLLPLVFYVLKTGHVEGAINFTSFLGIIKAFELMLAVHNVQFFVHLFLVITTAAAVHVKKYQITALYIISIMMFAGKIVINMYYQSVGLITSYDMYQIVHSVFSGILFLLAIRFITGIIEREISLSCEFEQQAHTDSLTGAFNRRKFSQTATAGRKSSDSAFCMIDIDHFKHINDTWGHDTGDEVLKELTGLIKGSLRDNDTLYRWGGEEFLLIIPCFSIEEALIIVERIRKEVMNHLFIGSISVTFSAGIAMQADDDEFMLPLRKADVALYNAKKSGRNRVETA